jgi:hypothetical protein
MSLSFLYCSWRSQWLYVGNGTILGELEINYETLYEFRPGTSGFAES